VRRAEAQARQRLVRALRAFAQGDARQARALAQASLRLAHSPLAARLLLSAIRGHAWTFAGSGHFEARAGHPVVLSISHNPMCRGARLDEPGCDFYAATFERLFRELVHPDALVVETHCEACGDAMCRFEVRWRGGA